MLAVLLLVFYCCDATVITRNGHFEVFDDWIIVPLQIWCDSWCAVPEAWAQQNNSHYILVPPESSAHIAQTYNQTHLEELYDVCTLKFSIRATEPLDTQFSVVWDNAQYEIEWVDLFLSSSMDWTELEMTFEKMSSSLEFSFLTGTDAWISLDSVELDCEKKTWHTQKLIIITGTCVLGLLILFSLLRVIRKYAQCDCCCSSKTPEFITLEEFEPMPNRSPDDI
jgi:hypothetical protein